MTVRNVVFDAGGVLLDWNPPAVIAQLYPDPAVQAQIREYIFEQLAAPEQRRVRYWPESAYWIATDIDVPAFLPEFIESRHLDIQRLDADARAMGLRLG